MKAALKFSFLINRNIKFSWEQMDPYDESSPTVRLWLSFNSQGGKAGNSWLLLGEQSPPPQFTWNIIYTAINIQGWRLEIQLGLRDGWTDRLSAGFELTIKNHNKTRPVFWENIRQWRSHSDCWLQVFLMFLGTEALWILQVWWLQGGYFSYWTGHNVTRKNWTAIEGGRQNRCHKLSSPGHRYMICGKVRLFDLKERGLPPISASRSSDDCEIREHS